MMFLDVLCVYLCVCVSTFDDFCFSLIHQKLNNGSTSPCWHPVCLAQKKSGKQWETWKNHEQNWKAMPRGDEKMKNESGFPVWPRPIRQWLSASACCPTLYNAVSFFPYLVPLSLGDVGLERGLWHLASNCMESLWIICLQYVAVFQRVLQYKLHQISSNYIQYHQISLNMFKLH